MGEKQEHSSSVAGSGSSLRCTPAELIAKLEAAASGSVELDVAVAFARCSPELIGPYTTSTDAALSLVEHRFPGAEAAIYTNWPLTKGQPQNPDGSWTITDETPRGCWVRFNSGPYLGPLYNASGKARTPALAVCAALLSAELAKVTAESVAAKATLSTTQRDMLVRIVESLGWYPGSHGATTVRKLAALGLAFKSGKRGPYLPTGAGRAYVEMTRSEPQPRAPQEDRPGRVMNPDPALARKEP